MKNHLLVSLLLLAGALATATSVAAQTDYIVGSQDVLTITVFGERDFSGKYTVEQDGTFTYPQLGRIKAGGLTLRALEQELRKQLSDGYLKNPQVGVAIETYKSQQVLVLGEVRSPGPYQLAGGMTVLQVVAQAGSTTPAASRQVLVVRPARKDASQPDRPRDNEAEVIRVDLAQLQAGDLTMNIALRDGDTVNVLKAQSVFVAGHVKSPGAYAVEPGTTVLQALSLAGGLTDRGADGRIRIQRTVNGKKVEQKAKLSDVVEPGDTIIVPERFF
jgi:polysaccharide export outer membrane protein